VRSLWRWVLACVVPTVAGAAVWFVFERMLGVDRATAAASGIGFSAIVVVPMGWWAAREPKPREALVAPRPRVSIDSVGGGSCSPEARTLLQLVEAGQSP
jgi:hypothetical protein